MKTIFFINREQHSVISKLRIIVLIFLLVLTNSIEAQVTQQEFEALKSFYKAFAGGNWVLKTNWDTTATANDVTSAWYGLTVESGHVTKIIFGNDNLVGSIPSQIGDFPELQVLKITENSGVTGEIPIEIGKLTKLTHLSLYNNNLSGSLPPEIGNLSQVVTMWLSANNLSGHIPSTIGNLKKLVDFNCNYDFFDSIPDQIGDMSSLEKLYFRANKLHGHIPLSIGNLSNLKELDFTQNQFSGAIPKEICNLTNLEELELGQNNFSGYIPIEIDNMKSLQEFRIDNNKISGSIPKQICSLPLLRKLYLNNNKISGQIPAEIGNLDSLRNFCVSYNQLFGSVPASIISIPHLESIEIQSNNISKLPNLSNLSSVLIAVENNKLNFDDIEPNVSVLTTYSPQGLLGQKQIHHVDIGANYSLVVNAGGTHSVYQWYKDNSQISGAIDSIYTVQNFQVSDAGVYYCKIDNTVASSLTLQSNNITLTNSDIPQVYVSTSSVDLGNIAIGKDTVVKIVVSGKNLSSSIFISTGSNSRFFISADSSVFGTSISLSQTGGYNTDTAVFIKYYPDGITTNYDQLKIQTGGAADQYVQLLGKAHQSTTTQISEFDKNQFNLYPNPCNSILYIENNESKNYYLSIFNQNGQIVKQVKNFDNQIGMDLSVLPAGLYIVKIRTDKYIFYTKIIKQ